MPPRWVNALIVVSWLGVTGWLFWHDLWPSWRPGEPPMFYIDLVEEVQNPDRLKTTWNVQRQTKDDREPRNVFHATTWVDYQQEDDTFTLHAQMDAKRLPRQQEYALRLLLDFAVKSMTSEYRVNRMGQLRELRCRVNVIQDPTARGQPKGNTGEEAQLVLEGQVRDEQFFAHCRASATLLPRRLEMDLPPVSLSHNGSVLLPLHPVNRIHGLRPGQNWRQPLIDPFRDASNALFGLGGSMRYINAHVLPQPQVLKRDDGSETTCLVIEYEDEGQFAGSTWVEQDSERVEKQEAILDSDRWLMKRDNPRKAFKGPF